MKIPVEVQCKTCSQVFCCAKCRQKHEDNAHQELQAIRQICYICNNRPFPLRIDTKITPRNMLIEHILKEHLPLRCNRCSKVFHSAADFKSIARCLTGQNKDTNCADESCHLERNVSKDRDMSVKSMGSLDEEENKENHNTNGSAETFPYNAMKENEPQTVIKAKAFNKGLATPKISKELRAITDPIEEIGDIDEAQLTPLSMINLRWKRKSRQSFESILCTTTNISAVNASEGAVVPPNSPKKKLVRTTSTPMMHCWLPNVKGVNESYSSAMAQMSSIHSYSGSELKTDDVTPISPTSYEIQKVRAIIRSKSKVAATPLRQVMSKSIQRAIAQHGYYSKMLAPGTQRKMSFNSTASSGLNSSTESPSRGALDLRTTPVLKRSSSESSTGSQRTAKMICVGKAQSEDSSTSTLEQVSQIGSQYFETHQSLDSLNADQENWNNHKIVEESLNASDTDTEPLKPIPSCYQDTPKATGWMLKKVISFTTPETTKLRIENDELDETGDVWATPCSVPPRSFSCSALVHSRNESFLTDDNDDPTGNDEVFQLPVRSKSCKQLKLSSPTAPSTGKLWTFVSNVIRLTSRSDIQRQYTDSASGESSDSDSKISSTLFQKASSLAGFLKKRLPSHRSIHTSTDCDDFLSEFQAGSKRRRADSVYTRPYDSIGKNIVKRTTCSPLAKRKRIQGRQPIERMRHVTGSGDNGSDIGM